MEVKKLPSWSRIKVPLLSQILFKSVAAIHPGGISELTQDIPYGHYEWKDLSAFIPGHYYQSFMVF
jgi:hypothetical protein